MKKRRKGPSKHHPRRAKPEAQREYQAKLRGKKKDKTEKQRPIGTKDVKRHARRVKRMAKKSKT